MRNVAIFPFTSRKVPSSVRSCRPNQGPRPSEPTELGTSIVFKLMLEKMKAFSAADLGTARVPRKPAFKPSAAHLWWAWVVPPPREGG